ncbi:MAG: PQQ-binding-like beta-propeller repeat protein, partial [Methanocella sp.]
MEKDRLFMTVMIALLIFLGVVLLFGVTGNRPASGEQWSFSANDSLRENNMFVDDDGTFYTTAGHTIYALSADGNTRWSLDPGFASWYDYNYKNLRIQAAAFDNGYSFMMVIPSDRKNTLAADGKLLAISPEGSVVWSRDAEFLKGGSLATVDGLLVAFHNYNMSVFDTSNGTLRWSIGNVDSPVADQDGSIYLIKDPGENRLVTGSLEVVAFGPDGTRRWSHLLSEYGIDRLAYGSSLMFLNETLYLPYYNGIIA